MCQWVGGARGPFAPPLPPSHHLLNQPVLRSRAFIGQPRVFEVQVLTAEVPNSTKVWTCRQYPQKPR